MDPENLKRMPLAIAATGPWHLRLYHHASSERARYKLARFGEFYGSEPPTPSLFYGTVALAGSAELWSAKFPAVCCRIQVRDRPILQVEA